MSKELNKTYDPKDIEDRLYQKWEENGYFHAEVDRSKKPFTIVMPPPNITGQLHMGHALDQTLQDVLSYFQYVYVVLCAGAADFGQNTHTVFSDYGDDCFHNKYLVSGRFFV